MEYTIVFIDDVSKDNEQKIIWKYFPHCKITSYSDKDVIKRKNRDGNSDFKLKKSFISLISTTPIDIIACDVNLWDGKKDTWVQPHLISLIRKYNKTVRMISYSGAYWNIFQNWYDKEEGKIKSKYLRKIPVIINDTFRFFDRGNRIQWIWEVLTEINFPLEIEKKLLLYYPEKYFLIDKEKYTWKDIASFIHDWDEKWIKFIKFYVLDFALSNLDALLYE